MRTVPFKVITMMGTTLAAHLIALGFLYKVMPHPKEQRIAIVDLQSLLLSELKGNATQTDAELALKMRKLHHQIHHITTQLSLETGALIVSKEALLSKGEDWTEIVRKKLENLP
ncbi:MAG: hypothetical protein BGO76_00985 [Caedibacter sp. 38-128]|nr:hypothetical protein [Holosporales bacterium]OJX06104.1 MAG: hypothetical protein BGO76_00985 [Caedibacter sp. 38-128]